MRGSMLALCAALATACGVASAATPDRVLVFTRTAEYRHDSIPTAIAGLQQVAKAEGMPVDYSEADFTPANLAR